MAITNNGNRQLLQIRHNQYFSPQAAFIQVHGGRGKFHCSTFQKHALALQLATLLSVPSVFSEQEVGTPSDHQHQSTLGLSAAGHTVLTASRCDLNWQETASL